jgi:hypothetical protein
MDDLQVEIAVNRSRQVILASPKGRSDMRTEMKSCFDF